MCSESNCSTPSTAVPQVSEHGSSIVTDTGSSSCRETAVVEESSTNIASRVQTTIELRQFTVSWRAGGPGMGDVWLGDETACSTLDYSTLYARNSAKLAQAETQNKACAPAFWPRCSGDHGGGSTIHATRIAPAPAPAPAPSQAAAGSARGFGHTVSRTCSIILICIPLPSSIAHRPHSLLIPLSFSWCTGLYPYDPCELRASFPNRAKPYICQPSFVLASPSGAVALSTIHIRIQSKFTTNIVIKLPLSQHSQEYSLATRDTDISEVAAIRSNRAASLAYLKLYLVLHLPSKSLWERQRKLSPGFS